MSKIIEFRKKLNIKQKDFAKILDISVTHLYYIENNLKYPSIELAYKIKKLAKQYKFKLTLEDIFCEFLSNEIKDGNKTQ